MSTEIKRPLAGRPRGIEAISAAGVVVGESLLKSYRLRDGRQASKLGRRELLALAEEAERDARALRALAEESTKARDFGR